MTQFLLPKLRGREWLQPSVLALIAANIFPLIGVFVFHWEVFPLLLLFWSENVVVGLLNALKMICAAPSSGLQWGLKLFLVPFFCFHYGMFTFVHGVFVVVLFGGGLRDRMGFPNLQTFLEVIREHQLTWAVLALFASHGISFAHNFIVRGEFRRTSAPVLMMQPYGRIIVLHLTVLFGGFLVMILKSPALGLALLIILKVMLDLTAHLKERAKLSPPPVARESTSPL